MKLAWACWYLANFSFGGSFQSAWKTDIQENRVCVYLRSKKESVNQYAVKRLESTQIENNDAVRVVRKFDNKHSFFYLDPPYIDANQQHYKGYKVDEYRQLLLAAEEMKGRFMLSCFQSEILAEFVIRNNWNVVELDLVNYATMTRRNNGESKKRKTELLVMNYTIQSKQLSLI